MSGKFVVSLTRAKDDTDRARVAFVVANAAVANDENGLVFLNIEDKLIPDTGIVGGAMRVESVGEACPSPSYWERS